MRRSWLITTWVLWTLGTVQAIAAPVPVTGQIVDSKGRPVGGARVELVPVVSRFAAGEIQLQGKDSPEPAARTVSGADGRFAISAPAPGMWSVEVATPGFARRVLSLTPLLEAEELPRLEMTAEAPVRVRVVDAQGRPVAGARVRATGFASGYGPLWWARSQLASTGPDGTAALSRGEKGEAQVWITAAGHPPASWQVSSGESAAEVRLAAVCPRAVQVTGQVNRPSAGSSRPVAGAQIRHQGVLLGVTDDAGRLTVPAPCDRDLPLSIEARDGRWADATLPRRPRPEAADAPPLAVVLPAQPVRVSGRVQEKEARSPVAGALVWPLADPAAFVRTDARGAYTVTLTMDGERTAVAADAVGYLEDAQPARAGEAGPTLSLRPMATASGAVVDEAGRPVADAEVAMAATDTRTGDSWGPPSSVRSDAQGKFRLRGLAGMALTLTARHPDFVPGKLSLPAVAPRASRSGLRIVLARGLSAAGRVLGPDGQPIAGAEVWLARSDAEEWDSDRRPATAVTGADGRFILHHLEPGRADLTAAARGFAPTRVPGLEIPESPETLDLGTVTLAPGMALRGVVVDPGDEPVAGAQVLARGLSGYIPRGWRPTGIEETQTAADGSFSIPDLSPGARFALDISKKGYTRTKLQSLQVSPEPLRIVLTPGSRIAGRVIDEKGEPVRDATVSLARIGTESAALTFESEHLAGTGRSEVDGGFEIDGVPAGKLRLVARHPHFLDGEIPVLDVVAGRDLENVELKLRRGAVVTGRVTGADGSPLEGATVRPVRGSGGEPFFPIYRGARADAEGQYRIEGVPDGVHSFEAKGPGLQPLIRELQVRPGENRLDFRLAAAHEVSGRVLDAAGAPVAGARVSLMEPGSPTLVSMPGHQRLGVPTGADGSFRIEDAVTGVYDLQAAKEGYAPGRLARVEVAGRVQGLELRLEAGGSIQGRLTGVELADLAGVRLSAYPARPGEAFMSHQGQADYQGVYRIDGLAAGDWRVLATAADGRKASGQATVRPGAETVLDLDFEESDGLTLTGRVLRHGEPVPNAAVTVWSQEGREGGYGSDHTGPEGAFRIPGLAPGAYNLRAVLPGSGVEHRGTVELTADRDILVEISGHRVSGRVIDATDQSPIALAAVFLEPEALGAGIPYSPPRRAGGDDKGAFAFADVAPGTYRLKAQVEGYAVTETTVQVSEGGVDGVVLALQPTEGLTLEIRGALGSAPPEVEVALLDNAGRAVLTQGQRTGENGRVRLTSAPPGLWQLLVSASGYATVGQTVQVPGPAVPVTLPRASTLTVAAAALPTGSVVTIAGAGGQPFRRLAWGSVYQQWILHDGQAVIEGLPPGRWQVRIFGPGEQAWQAEVTTAAGSPARVVVR